MSKYIFSHPTGTKKIPKREIKKDSNGVKYIGYVVDVKGKPLYDDWYGKIQKSSDSCNVRLLLERAVQSDNTAILNQRKKVSADLSGVPDNLLDVLNTFQSVKNYFEQLPVEIKKDFSNNPYEFIKRSGKVSSEFEKLYKNSVKPVEDEKANDIKKDGE